VKVAVAMSGGMDSTAAALLLAKQGRKVVGLHMVLHKDSAGAWENARIAAEEVGIRIHRVDLRGEFTSLVVKPFVREYAAGRTPSPCPICNRFLKMEHLFDRAVSLGCTALATGHYARIAEVSGEPALVRGTDEVKDQSYFLFMLTPQLLRRCLFPLGGLTKDKVRSLLRAEGISASESSESQELCFIPGGNYREFLRSHGVSAVPGPIVDAQGRKLGTHGGIAFYTVGQRHGLGACGPTPRYVIRIEGKHNRIVVGERSETLVSEVRLGGINLVRTDCLTAGERLEIKVRSTSRAVVCTLVSVEGDRATLRFDEPQSGVAPGQAGVFYDRDRLIGGGWIF
jgi:tRNA-uridine 2-sulfurtransferase